MCIRMYLHTYWYLYCTWRKPQTPPKNHVNNRFECEGRSTTAGKSDATATRQMQRAQLSVKA